LQKLRKCHSDSSEYSSTYSFKQQHQKHQDLSERPSPAAQKQEQQHYNAQHQHMCHVTQVHAAGHTCKHRAYGWRRRCRSYSRLDGWWVLTAEFLGTIILIALCVVAANQVRQAVLTCLWLQEQQQQQNMDIKCTRSHYPALFSAH
jgi:hypothetical protein